MTAPAEIMAGIARAEYHYLGFNGQLIEEEEGFKTLGRAGNGQAIKYILVNPPSLHPRQRNSVIWGSAFASTEEVPIIIRTRQRIVPSRVLLLSEHHSRPIQRTDLHSQRDHHLH